MSSLTTHSAALIHIIFTHLLSCCMSRLQSFARLLLSVLSTWASRLLSITWCDTRATQQQQRSTHVWFTWGTTPATATIS